VDVFIKRCFAVFCGAFAVFCVRVFSVFYKTAQNRPKNSQNDTQNERNVRFVQYAIQRNTVCCATFSHSENVHTKICKTRPKSRKHPKNTTQNTVFF